jgi:ribosomal protein S18 acetylase RimI-like enzyme
MYRRILAEERWMVTRLDEFTGTDEWQAKIIRKLNSSSNSRFLAARIGPRIVGALSISGGEHDRLMHRGEIEIFVDSDCRGMGVGRALMEAAITWAKANPILDKLSLHVFGDNTRAIALYQRFGFIIEGRMIGAFLETDGSRRDNVAMALFV